MLSFPGIRDGVVNAVAPVGAPVGSPKRLVAYFVPSGPEVDRDELTTHLRSKLPAYMVPSTFVTLEALPLSSNGKVDRKQLPDPAANRAEAVIPRPPKDDLERTLCGLLGDVLGIASPSANESFFALGGSSLAALRFVTRIREKLGAELPVVAVSTLR